MKTFFNLCAFLLLNLNIYAQVASKTSKKIDTIKTYFITYDFKTGGYEKALFKPKVDRPIVFKITNINRLAYEVKVNPNDEIIAETDWFTSGEDLRKITQVFSENNTAAQAKVEESIKIPDVKPDSTATKSDLNKKQIEAVNISDKLSYDLSQIKKEYDQLLKDKDTYDTYKKIYGDSLTVLNIQKTDESKIIDLKNQMDAILLKIRDIRNRQNDKLSEFQSAKEKFIIAHQAFIQSYFKINSIFQSANLVLPVAKQPFLSLNEYRNKHQVNFRIILLNLLGSNITVNTINHQYTDLVVSYNRLKDVDSLENYFNKASLKRYFDDIDLVFDNAKKIRFKEELVDFEKIATQVIRVINLLDKEETYEYISEPVQPRNDMATFEVSINSKIKDVEVDNSRSFKHAEFVRRGTRIDFSIGLAGSYFGKTKTYEVTVKDSIPKIGLKGKSLTVPSLIAMLSMTSRSSKYIAWGGSTGLGIDINNGKIQMSNFFIGPTAVLGKYDRLMFTPGVAFRNVGKLRSGFAEGDTLNQTSDINTVLSDSYKLGFFTALTYNLTKNVRTKISNYKP